MDLAYLGGFFDGEGNVGLYKSGGESPRLRVQVFQNHGASQDRLMHEIHDTFGGTLHDRGTGYLYSASGSRAVDLLTQLRPHLRLKLEQADEALEWWRNRTAERFRSRTAEEVAYDESAMTRLKELKRAG
ncbi:LAGLIDADG endonuclease [Mycobacterium phage Skinny]|nr:LAGLIDADG endonuclease [Mycobacterium phage Skinny]